MNGSQKPSVYVAVPRSLTTQFERAFVEQLPETVCRAGSKFSLSGALRASDFGRVDVGYAHAFPVEPERVAIDHAVHPATGAADGKIACRRIGDEMAVGLGQPYTFRLRLP